MAIQEYQPIKFVSGPFAGLLGKALSPAGEGRWYVQVMIAGNAVTREVAEEEIDSL